MITENQLEQLCISWFKENGYQAVTGKQISPEGDSPERDTYRQVVLHDRLVSQLKLINPQIPPILLEDVANTLVKPDTPLLIKNNHRFHKYMIEGVPVEINNNKDNKIEYIKLIDFEKIENNQFLVVDQLTISGTKHFRRPDLIVFINGLPIAVIELKNPADENADIWDAYNQLQTYKDEISDLFVFNEALVISDGLTARVGSLTASKEWFMPWRTIKDENDKPDLAYELEKLDINKHEIETLNKEVEEVFEEDEDLIQKEQTKSKWATLEKLVGSGPRIEQVAKDLVDHFTTRTDSFPGKAMIVCMSREICVNMFDAIIKLKPEWKGTLKKEGKEKQGFYDPHDGDIRVVMTGSASDKSHLQKHIYNKAAKNQLEKRFKDETDALKIVIVRDMWLTGFDVPACHTMYVDKPMKGHNLMQAIARVNRVFKDKPGGLVVDYIGIANELKLALKIYTDANGRGEPTLNTKRAYEILLEKMDIARGLFHGFDYSDYKINALQLLPLAMNHILGLEEGKKRFLDVVVNISKAFTLCGTLDEVQSLKKEIAFFSAVKAAISKYTSIDKKRTEADKSSALKQIIDNAIIADGVADVFELAGLEKPNIGLLSHEFLEDVGNMKTKNLAVALLERLIKDEIKARMKNDVVQEKKYSDRILETLRKYHNRAIETAQVIEELIQMAKDMVKDEEMAEKSGLNRDEIAFYRALIQNESAVRELAREVTQTLKKSTTVDWQVRDSVRAKLRILIRRTLKRWKYPPDGAKEAVELVLKQAEALSNTWSQ